MLGFFENFYIGVVIIVYLKYIIPLVLFIVQLFAAGSLLAKAGGKKWYAFIPFFNVYMIGKYYKVNLFLRIAVIVATLMLALSYVFLFLGMIAFLSLFPNGLFLASIFFLPIIIIQLLYYMYFVAVLDSIRNSYLIKGEKINSIEFWLGTLFAMGAPVMNIAFNNNYEYSPASNTNSFLKSKEIEGENIYEEK